MVLNRTKNIARDIKENTCMWQAYLYESCLGVKDDRNGGFAMLVFVLIVAMSLLVMMISYAENQKRIADNVREIIKTERGLQSALLCVGYISRSLSRYPLLNEDIILNIKSLSISKLGDNNWINNVSYNNYNQSGVETFDCNVVEFDNCERLNSNNSSGGCDYRAIIEGYNTFKNQDEDNHLKIYLEWRLEEYRFYISKLRLINNFIFSLEFL